MDSYLDGMLAKGPAALAQAPGMSRCPGCGATGRGVTRANGYCDHCNRQAGGDARSPTPAAAAAGAKRSRAQFEASAAAATAAGGAGAGSSADDGGDDAAGGAGGAGGGAGELSAAEIAAMLEASERAEVPALDSHGVRKMLLSLERRINRNALARSKYSDQPARFLESEVELDEELKSLRCLAAAPEMYPLLVRSDSLRSLLGLLAHDNVDIAGGVIALLDELTDEDAIGPRPPGGVDETEPPADGGDGVGDDEEDELAAAQRRSAATFRHGAALVSALVEAGGLELIVQNLGRLDDGSSEEDSQGVYATLSLLENLVEVQPSLSVTLCGPGAPASPKPLLPFLLRKLRARTPFDANKLAAAELLAVLLSADLRNAALLGASHFQLSTGGGGSSSSSSSSVAVVDGIEYLLELLNAYKKRDPSSGDEEEAVNNVYNALFTCLLVPANQERFRAAEGIELMLRVVHENGFARLGALKALSYAVAGNARNAAALVAAGGLKAVFPSFMGAGVAHTRRYHGEDGVAEEEEQVVALVASLVALLPPTGSGAGAAPAAGEAWLRLLAKFREDGGAKLHRLVDLYVTAADRVAAAEAEADADGGDDDEDEDAGDGADDDDIETDAVAEAKRKRAELRADLRYAARLDGGLATLQRVCSVIAAVVAAGGDGAPPAVPAGDARAAPLSPALAALGRELALALRGKLYEQGGSLTAVAEVLAEQHARALAAEASAGGDGDGDAGLPAAAASAAQLGALIGALTKAVGSEAEGEGASVAPAEGGSGGGAAER